MLKEKFLRFFTKNFKRLDRAKAKDAEPPKEDTKADAESPKEDTKADAKKGESS